MLHRNRTWGITRCESTDELVERLLQHTWTLCTAFETAAGTIWANDSTEPDGLQEYAVLRPGPEGKYQQIESITTSWCTADRLKEFIADADNGRMQSFAHVFGNVDVEQLEREHLPCPHCK